MYNGEMYWPIIERAVDIDSTNHSVYMCAPWLSYVFIINEGTK